TWFLVSLFLPARARPRTRRHLTRAPSGAASPVSKVEGDGSLGQPAHQPRLELFNDNPAGPGHQQRAPDRVGEQARHHQQQAAHKDIETVQKLFSGYAARFQRITDAPEHRYPLAAGYHGPDEPRS